MHINGPAFSFLSEKFPSLNTKKGKAGILIIIIIIIIFIQLQLGWNPVAEVYNTYTANV
jgi:hypothetical protein